MTRTKSSRSIAIRAIANDLHNALAVLDTVWKEPSEGDITKVVMVIAQLEQILANLHGLRMQGSKHPLQRPVLTPRGRFPNIAAASAAHGITRQSGWDRATRRVFNWRFEDDTGAPPPKPKRGPPTKEPTP